MDRLRNSKLERERQTEIQSEMHSKIQRYRQTDTHITASFPGKLG